jgi:hypothetical protein
VRRCVKDATDGKGGVTRSLDAGVVAETVKSQLHRPDAGFEDGAVIAAVFAIAVAGSGFLPRLLYSVFKAVKQNGG